MPAKSFMISAVEVVDFCAGCEWCETCCSLFARGWRRYER
jgi:hypothetical protein